MSTGTTAWVVGGRGLLGRAVTAAIERRPGWRALKADPLPWSDISAAPSHAADRLRDLQNAARRTDDRWAVIWAAGSGVTSSSEASLELELEQLHRILAAFGDAVTDAERGGILYASSAGGVYAGSPDPPPFTERSTARAIAPYGRLKLAAEKAVRGFAEDAGIRSIAGRISNLYGPGQNLEKMQGLISQLAKAQFSTTPASVYVSLDTIRDYLFVDDCAELVLDCLDRLATGEERHVTKILASGEGSTISVLIGQLRRLAKAAPHVMLGESAAARFQAHDLRLRSVVWPELDRRPLTPLPAGMHATMLEIIRGIQAGATRPQAVSSAAR
jgi:UDP-glucose 4-epimerase